jgi:integrase
MMTIIDFANKSKMLNTANVYRNERFPTTVAAEEQRSAYSSADTIRLVDAICSEPLWSKGPPRPERFWIILIALFHGLRLGNIVALTKKDICQTDHGMWILEIRKGKTVATIRPIAICDSLLLLGFLEWVATLPGNRLFPDSVATFSTWYNRSELRDGKPVMGFESRHVTTDKKKCLYSLRHSFAGNVFDVTSDYKVTADMLGHSTGKSVTARYTKVSKAESLKEITEKMRIEHIDLDKLEARAKELFHHLA